MNHKLVNKAQWRQLCLICTDGFNYHAPVQRKRPARLINWLWKLIYTGGFFNKTASENKTFPLAVVASVLSRCCLYVSRMLQLHIPDVSSIFESYICTQVFHVVRRVRGAEECGAASLWTWPRCTRGYRQGHNGAEVPLPGRGERMGMGTGCGRVRHKRGHFDGSEAHVQCVRDGLGHPQWEFHDTVFNTLIF